MKQSSSEVLNLLQTITQLSLNYKLYKWSKIIHNSEIIVNFVLGINPIEPNTKPSYTSK